MSENESPTKPNSKFAFLVICALVLIFCGGPLTWWFGRQAIARRELDEKRDELIARGMPVDDESMEMYRAQNMSHDKSDAWMRILDTVTSDEFNQSCTGVPRLSADEDIVDWIPGEPYPHDEIVRSFLDEWQDLLSNIHDVTEDSGPIWTKVEFDSFSTLLPYTQNTRQVIRILALEFEDAVRRGDGDQAFKSLKAMIGTARSQQKEPIIVSQLVHLALVAVAIDQIQVAIEQDILDERQLISLLQQLRTQDDFGPQFRMSIAGERAMAIPIFDDPSRLDESGGGFGSSIMARSIDAVAHMKLMQRAEDLDTSDLNTFFEQATELDSHLSEEMQAGGLKRLDTMLTSMITPAIGGYTQAIVRNAMRVRMAKLAIALRIYEKRNGQFPETLDELVKPEMRLDLGPTKPIGPSPFGYTYADGKATLWGFRLRTGARETPPQPEDYGSQPEHEDEDIKSWIWNLEESNNANPG